MDLMRRLWRNLKSGGGEEQGKALDQEQAARRATKAILLANKQSLFTEEDAKNMTEEQKEAELIMGMKSLKIPEFLIEGEEGEGIRVPTVSEFEMHMEARRHGHSSFTGKCISLLCELLEPSLTSRISKRTFRSQEAILKEKLRQSEVNQYMIHPFSAFRWYWDLIMIVTLLATIIYLPLEVAFYSESTTDTHWKVVNILVDIVFLIDIFFNFRTGYLHPATEEVILDNKKMVRHYLLTWFIIDFVSSVPFDYLYVAIVDDASITHENVFITQRVMRFVKMLSLLRVLRLARLWRYIHKFEEILDIDTKVISAFNLVMMMLVYCHWNGCVQYLVAFVEEFPEDGWAAQLSLNATGVYTIERYTHSMFRAMSHMMSIGYGHTPPTHLTDLWMVICSMALGGTFYALFIGHLSRIVLTMDSSGRRYEEKVSEVREYLRFRRMPVSIQSRVLEYYDHKYQRKYFDEHRILSEPSMSDPLRQDNENDTNYNISHGITGFDADGDSMTLPEGARYVMMMHNCRNLVEKVPFLSSAPPDFLFDIICKLSFQVFFPGDVIVQAGKRGDCMFFIEHGKVEVQLISGHVVNVLGDGTHFGEISLILDEKRVASVVAVEMCDMYRLTKYNFDDVLEDHPGMKKVLESIAKERLQETRETDVSSLDSFGNLGGDDDLHRASAYSCRFNTAKVYDYYEPRQEEATNLPRLPPILKKSSELPDVNL